MYSESQKLRPSDEIELFELSRYNPNSPFDTYYFSNASGVVFDDVTYSPLNCQIEGIEHNSEGKAAQPKLTLTDVSFQGKSIISDLILRFNGLENAILKYRTTLRMYLSGQQTSNPLGVTKPKKFYVRQVSRMVPAKEIEVNLTTALGMVDSVGFGKLLMPRCRYVFEDDQCTYSGTKMYDVYGNPTLDEKKKGCGKSVTNCRQYFGSNAILPFGGEPGVDFLG